MLGVGASAGVRSLGDGHLEEVEGKGSNSNCEAYLGSDAREIFYADHARLAEQRLNNKVLLPIDMTQSQWEKLNAIVAPLICGPSEEAIKTQNFSMHPIPFAQTYICEQIVQKFSDKQIGKNMRDEAKIPMVGEGKDKVPMPKKGTKSCTHMSCMKMDGREEYRVLKAVLKTSNFEKRMNNYLQGACCVGGAENCVVKTPKLCCNNVLFWLDMRSLFQLFDLKCVQQLYAAMVFPKGLLEAKDTFDQENEINFIVQGKNAMMSFRGDESIAYLQDLKVWQEYFTAGVKDGRKFGYNFNLLFEHMTRVGRMTVVVVSRVYGKAMVPRLLTPPPDTILIPNWITIIAELGNKLGMKWFSNLALSTNKIAKLFSELPTFKVSRQFLSELDLFLFNRPDAQIDRQSAGTMLSSKIHSIVVGNHVIQRGHSLTLSEAVDLCTILLLRSFIARMRSSKVIGYGVKHVLQGKQDKGFLESCIELLRGIDLPVVKDWLMIRRFAADVMGTSKTHEVVRRFILNVEQPVAKLYQEIAKEHRHASFVIPEEREFVFDPNNDGKCYQSCVAKIGGKSNIAVPYPIRAEVEREMREMELPESKFQIKDGHCKLVAKTSDFCKHGVSKDMYIEDIPGKMQKLSGIAERRWLRNTGNINGVKTSHMLKRLPKGKVANLCAAPANDELVWSKRKGDIHCYDLRYLEDVVLPRYHQGNKAIFEFNILCHNCVQEIEGYSVLADLGTELPQRYMSVFFATALRNLRANVRHAAVKVQNFTTLMEQRNNFMLLEESRHWSITFPDCFNANEALLLLGHKGEEDFIPDCMSEEKPDEYRRLKFVCDELKGKVRKIRKDTVRGNYYVHSHGVRSEGKTKPEARVNWKSKYLQRRYGKENLFPRKIEKGKWFANVRIGTNDFTFVGKTFKDVALPYADLLTESEDLDLRVRHKPRRRTPWNDMRGFGEDFEIAIMRADPYGFWYYDVEEDEEEEGEDICGNAQTAPCFYGGSLLQEQPTFKRDEVVSTEKLDDYAAYQRELQRGIQQQSHPQDILGKSQLRSLASQPSPMDVIVEEVEDSEDEGGAYSAAAVNLPHTDLYRGIENPKAIQFRNERVLVPMKGDGKCLYRCIAHHFTGDQERWQEFRQVLINHCEGKLQEHLQSDEWPEDCVLSYISDICEIDVVVQIGETNNHQSYGQRFQNRVYVRLKNGHYDFLAPSVKKQTNWKKEVEFTECPQHDGSMEFDDSQAVAKATSGLFSKAATVHAEGVLFVANGKLSADPRDCYSFSRSHLLKILLLVPSSEIKHLAQFVDTPVHPLSGKLPYWGHVLDVLDDEIVGIPFEEKQMEFKPVEVDLRYAVSGMPALSRELKTPGQYEETHKKAKVNLDALETLQPVRKICLLEGTYASGKSYLMKKWIRNQEEVCVVICPTSKLAKEYKDEGFNAFSWSVGMSKATEIPCNAVICIDEIFLFDPRVLLFFLSSWKKIIAVGDRRQLVCDAKVMMAKTLREAISNENEKVMISRTAPIDVVMLLNKEEKEPTYTLSKVLRSVQLRALNDPKDVPDAFVFDKKSATRHSESGHRTVATIQGLRTRHSDIIVNPNAKALITGCVGQKLVALTRHTQTATVWYTRSAELLARVFLCEETKSDDTVVEKVEDPNERIGGRDKYTTDIGEGEVLNVRYEGPNAIDDEVILTDNAEDDIHSVHYGAEQKYRWKKKNVGIFRATADKERWYEVAGIENKDAEVEPEVEQASLGVLGDVVNPVQLQIEKARKLQDKITRREEFLDKSEGRVLLTAPETYFVNQEWAKNTPVNFSFENVGIPEGHMKVMGKDMPEQVESRKMDLCAYSQLAPTRVSSIVEKCYPTKSRMAESSRVLSVDKMRAVLPGKKLKVKTDTHLTSIVTSDQMVMHSKVFGVQQTNEPNHRLNTAVERYGRVKKPKAGDLEKRLCKLKQGFAKFVNVSGLRPATKAEMEQFRSRALLRAAMKQHQDVTGMYGESWQTTERIKCFNKVQLKAKGGNYPYLSVKEADGLLYVKGGQMVSAQPKEVNQVASPYVNHAENMVMSCLKKGVFFGYGCSAKKLRNKMWLASRKGKAQSLSVDISEQDTTKDAAVTAMMRWIYESCGVPGNVIDAMEKPNANWVMSARSVGLRVKGQFQSGRADTLFANTCHILAEVGAAFEISDLDLALFQGDDCYLRAQHIYRKDDSFKNFKLCHDDVGEFISFLVSGGDLYLDTVRIASKLLSKSIVDDARFCELSTALRDLISINHELSRQYMNTLVVSAKYRITQGEAMELQQFLTSFARNDRPLMDKCRAVRRKGGVWNAADFEGVFSKNVCTVLHFK
ncbi:hypothetical protein [Beihai mantis shrimp virus 1]|uniref:hypothetical protein n=1 Tax=Beihai mantis shrimp virus 1 TaxID=1922428 RepID=UPI00090A2570|nr:hypothetical protein [Beihai mantis shrimp virus 1]APG77571.1 hypothetical protein [Beihai mantis shrimp virus 1]